MNPLRAVLPILLAMAHGSIAIAAQPTTSPAAFVRVSSRDAHYFELSDGRPYIPIGFNLVPPPPERDMLRVLDAMQKNGVNYCRIWLDQPPWSIEQNRSGEYDQAGADRLNQFLAACRRRGIRVKMCIEHFRNITPKRTIWSDKPLHHVANGGAYSDMKDFLTSPRGREQFKKKLAWYAKRCGDEPAVFAWELWNEMNAVRGEWRPWTAEMLAELHRLFPRNLCVQSLGSFDTDRVREPYRQLCTMEGNDVAQVHRYLDPGAALKICQAPVDLLAADAVGELRAFNTGKPIILTETGAVKPRHTGVSELYAADKDGVLLHDMIFAPFFSGAAGTGHAWWWPQAIDRPNLWHHFARFATAVRGIDPADESFVPVRIEHGRLRIYALKGRSTFIAWCRDGQNTWRSELVDGKRPELLKDQRVDLSSCGLELAEARARLFDPWLDRWADANVNGKEMVIPQLSRSIVIRLESGKNRN